MRFILDTTVQIKPGKGEQFQQWLSENEQRYAASYPDGISLFGMFVNVMGPGSGEVHILEILDSYGALDRTAAEAKKPDSDYRRIGDEIDQFIDLSRAMPTSVLLKDVLDATIINPKLEEEPELATV